MMRSDEWSESSLSKRTRRVVLRVILVVIVAAIGFAFLVDQMERRAIEYRTAEAVFADLEAGGFSCDDDPFFPRGSNEDPPYSVGQCEVGFSNVHVVVNQERGTWLGLFDQTQPWESGQAAVQGSNWGVSFEATNQNSIRLARQVRAIVGGELVHPRSQIDE